MSEQRFEDRARAIKAAKLVRVLERVLAENDALTVADVEAADQTFRERVRGLADVKPPTGQAAGVSDRTWAVACGILDARRSRAS